MTRLESNIPRGHELTPKKRVGTMFIPSTFRGSNGQHTADKTVNDIEPISDQIRQSLSQQYSDHEIWIAGNEVIGVLPRTIAEATEEQTKKSLKESLQDVLRIRGLKPVECAIVFTGENIPLSQEIIRSYDESPKGQWWVHSIYDQESEP